VAIEASVRLRFNAMVYQVAVEERRTPEDPI
jgi:hypothetical protein